MRSEATWAYKAGQLRYQTEESSLPLDDRLTLTRSRNLGKVCWRGQRVVVVFEVTRPRLCLVCNNGWAWKDCLLGHAAGKGACFCGGMGLGDGLGKPGERSESCSLLCATYFAGKWSSVAGRSIGNSISHQSSQTKRLPRMRNGKILGEAAVVVAKLECKRPQDLIRHAL